jgi:hypothetical protein
VPELEAGSRRAKPDTSVSKLKKRKRNRHRHIAQPFESACGATVESDGHPTGAGATPLWDERFVWRLADLMSHSSADARRIPQTIKIKIKIMSMIKIGGRLALGVTDSSVEVGDQCFRIHTSIFSPIDILFKKYDGLYWSDRDQWGSLGLKIG